MTYHLYRHTRNYYSSANAEPVGRIVGDTTIIDLLKNTFVKNGDNIFIPSNQHLLPLWVRL